MCDTRILPYILITKCMYQSEYKIVTFNQLLSACMKIKDIDFNFYVGFCAVCKLFNFLNLPFQKEHTVDS